MPKVEVTPLAYIMTEMKDVLGTREYKGLSHLLTCFSKMYEANFPLTSSVSLLDQIPAWNRKL